MVETVPAGEPVSAIEVGLLGYLTPNRIVDRGGIVTPGLVWHAESRRTPIREALELHPTDYLIVPSLFYAEIRAETRVIRVIPGNGYLTVLLVKRN